MAKKDILQAIIDYNNSISKKEINSEEIGESISNEEIQLDKQNNSIDITQKTNDYNNSGEVAFKESERLNELRSDEYYQIDIGGENQQTGGRLVDAPDEKEVNTDVTEFNKQDLTSASSDNYDINIENYSDINNYNNNSTVSNNEVSNEEANNRKNNLESIDNELILDIYEQKVRPFLFNAVEANYEANEDLELTEAELNNFNQLGSNEDQGTILDNLKDNTDLYLNQILNQNTKSLRDEINIILQTYNRTAEGYESNLEKNYLNNSIEELSELNAVEPFEGTNFDKASELTNNEEGYEITGLPKFLDQGASPVEEIITNTGKEELSDTGVQSLFLNLLPYVGTDLAQQIQSILSGSIDLGSLTDVVGAGFSIVKDASIINSIINTHTADELQKIITYNFFVLMTDRSITSIKDPHRKIAGQSEEFSGEAYLNIDDYLSKIRNNYLNNREDNNLELEELRNSLRNSLQTFDNPTGTLDAVANALSGISEGDESSTFGIRDYSTSEGGERTNILQTYYSPDGYNIKFRRDVFRNRLEQINEQEARNLLEDKYGDLLQDNKLGYLHIKPKDESIDEEIYGQYKIPFQFNPKISENSVEAKYATATILNRIGDLYNYTGTSQYSFSLETSYFVLSNSDNEDENYDLYGGHKDFIDQATLSLIQKIEYMWRGLVLPYQASDRNLFVPPPIIRVVLGGGVDRSDSDNENVPEDIPQERYSNFFTFPSKADLKKRFLRKFICTSVQINKNVDETPYVYKDGYVEDLLGFNVSASFVEVDPSYDDQLTLPDFSNYKQILDQSKLRL